MNKKLILGDMSYKEAIQICETHNCSDCPFNDYLLIPTHDKACVEATGVNIPDLIEDETFANC